MDFVEVEPGVYSVLIDGRQHELRVTGGGGSFAVTARGRQTVVEVRDPREWSAEGGGKAAAGKAKILSPMPGKVVRVMVEAGEAVSAGQAVVVVEAMKMQNELKSPIDGTVKKVAVVAGATVAANQVLVEVDADAG